jgi:hypothetical protein
MKAKLLVACLTGVLLSLHHVSAQKLDWAFRCGDTSSAGSVNMSPDGYLYIAFSFIGNQSFPNGDAFTTADNQTVALCIVKCKKNGDVVWARKIAVPGLPESDATHVVVNKIAFSPCGDRMYALVTKNNDACLVVLRKDGATVEVIGQQSVAFSDIAVDSNLNGYVTGTLYTYPSGLVMSAFLSKFDSALNAVWGYVFRNDTNQSIAYNVRYANGNVYMTGQYQGKVKVFDTTLNASANTLYANGGANSWDVFTVKYSPSGKKLSQVTSTGIPPIYIGGKLEIGTDMGTSGQWMVSYMTPTFPSGFDLKIKKFGEGFSSIGNPVSPAHTTCSFPPITSVKVNQCTGGGVVALATGLCSSEAHTFDQSGSATGDVIIPSGTDYAFHDYAFDADGAIYATASMIGNLSYRDSLGAQVLANKPGTHSTYVLKYHTCANYAPMVTKNGDTLACSITGLSFQWYKDGDPVPGATTQNYVPKETGSYSVKVTDGWGCTSTSSSFYSFVGVHELTTETVSVYPNPFTDIVYVEGLSKNSAGYITDISGKRLADVQFTTAKNQIDMTNFTTGIYFLFIDGRAVKLIKQ